MSSADIREVTTESERRAAFPVLVQLRDHLDVESFLALFEEMREEGTDCSRATSTANRWRSPA